MDIVLSPKTPFQRFRRRFFANRLVTVSYVVLCGVVLMAVLAPLLPISPYQTDFAARLQSPNFTNLLGTDQLGRDMLSRIIVGSGIALQVAFVSVFIGLIIGGLIGLMSGYFSESRLDAFLMRCMDVLLAFPWLLLVIAVVAILGPSIPNIMIAIGITLVPEYARLVRSTVLSIRRQEFVEAGAALGAKQSRIIFRYILPHCVPQLIVYSTIKMGRSILAEASVSYLGLGVQPPHPSWGAMIANGQQYLLSAPHLSLVPGVVVIIVVMSLNIIGDGFRDALDPRKTG